MIITESKLDRYRTAIYLRLSKVDGDKVESDSITNQRSLINDFLKAYPQFCVVDEYVDDGYSGANFDRPAFQRMYQDIQSGLINCVVVKDLSRFGRNYIEAGRYLERIFPLLKVRLIALADNYDGEKEWDSSDALIVPIKNLLNDAYCRDMSVKIKTQLEAKRRREEYVGNFAPYGYKKDPKNKNKLIIDEPAAEVVTLIFARKIEGFSEQRIADELNRKGILSPLEYKLVNGIHVPTNFRKKAKAEWAAEPVSLILHNEIYRGDLIQGKTKKLDYRSKKLTTMPKSNRVVIRNAVVPIIDQAQFEIVQNLMKKDTRVPPGEASVRIFSGYLYCGRCNNKMLRRVSKHGGHKYYSYICKTYRQEKGCTSHHISHKKLYPVVFEAIQSQIKLAVDTEKILAEIDISAYRERKVVGFVHQKELLQEEIEKYERIRANLYEDYSSEILSREDYLEYSEMYKEKIAIDRASISALDEEIRDSLESKRESEWIAAFRKYENITELTRPVVVELIDRIIIHDSGEIEIRFLFDDVVQTVMTSLGQSISLKEGKQNEENDSV